MLILDKKVNLITDQHCRLTQIFLYLFRAKAQSKKNKESKSRLANLDLAEDKDEKPSFKKLSGDHINRKKSSTTSNHSSKSNGSTEEWVTKSSLKSIDNDSSTSTNSSTSTSSSGSSYAPSTRSSRKSSNGSTKYKPSSSKSRKKVDIKALLKPKVIDETPKLTLEERELIIVENADDVQGNLIAQSLYV